VERGRKIENGSLIAKLIKNDDEVLLYVFVFTHNLIQKVDQLFGIMLYLRSAGSAGQDAGDDGRLESERGITQKSSVPFAVFGLYSLNILHQDIHPCLNPSSLPCLRSHAAFCFW
jgi:hypothetical protein